MMGTDFFQFGSLGAKIIGFKEGWGPKSLSGLRESFFLTLPLLVIIIKIQCALES